MTNISNLTNTTIFENEFNNSSNNLDYYSSYDYENPLPRQGLIYLGLVCVTPVLLGLPAYALVLYVSFAFIARLYHTYRKTSNRTL